jgi:copper homeostasis protein
MLLEISAYSIDQVKYSAEKGVDRVELCSNISEGGCTPSLGFIEESKKNDIEIYAIIRPRGGDFLYDDDEFSVMKKDVENFKKLGIDGIVTGILKEDGSVDVNRCKELRELARPMKFTFHRAFDMSRDWKEALEDIIEIGADTILTSGQGKSALEGIKVLKELVSLAKGRINILAGAGINKSNIKLIYEKANIENFHMSAVKYKASKMKFKNHKFNMGHKEIDEYSKLVVDSDKIDGAIKELKLLEK